MFRPKALRWVTDRVVVADIFDHPDECREEGNRCRERALGEDGEISGKWVYVVDTHYDALEHVPEHAIVGAWRLDGDEKLVKRLVLDPKYKGLK